MMKERFAKLLLGEDMSGGGNGVCTALAISIAITNISVEFKPSLQEFSGGGTFEVMVPRPRSDLLLNLPALKKLDAMLISILDGFYNSEFYYPDPVVVINDAGGIEAFPSSLPSGSSSVRLEEKCWLPFPKAPPLVYQKIQGRDSSSVGNVHARFMHFDCVERIAWVSALEMANRVEASVHIWKHKYLRRHSLRAKLNESAWGGKVKGFVGDREKTKVLAERAEALLQNLRLRFPGLRHSILESYSRVMESLAFNITARIDDMLYVDDATKKREGAESISVYELGVI
ncbi:Prolyl oligopeptidase family protein [Hibiscus syriacus]|uniref:Prolyl oligopeptidase family protein n=1 Tax=Hibiscus syriacus TaxID=106335 RepID=A0A6A2WQF6_HIBSY|nr:Prolyl oligopeptidase family protein [Hibiscus syriacus]